MHAITALIHRFPKLSCFMMGALASLAMAPTYYLPFMLFGMSVVTLIMARIESPRRGGWCVFHFGMGFFIFSLYWIANALLIKIEDYWWVIGFSIIGLPLLLSICWFIAGWLTVQFTKPDTLARSVLFISLLALAEYGRAFNLSGFPWNLFGYTWGFSLPMMQLASIGGAYFVTLLTMYWMALPALAYQARAHKKIQTGILAIGLVSLAAAYGAGMLRLADNPTRLRDDIGVVIIQPNISPDEKWETSEAVEHFLRHTKLMGEARSAFTDADMPESIAFVWPETSIDEDIIMGVPDAPRALLAAMKQYPTKTTVISGLWRTQGNSEKTGRPNYYNSIASLIVTDDKITLDTLYDKHHLVPFGEYLPLEQTLDLTPLVGFAGFKWGPGPRTQHPSLVPPFGAMICFEAIFPWYAAGQDTEWLVNTSNDGWYGDTPGPYQHLVMTRFRAVEQGKPIARSATTGISALIDPYGRTLEKRAYETQGYIASKLPEPAASPTLYTIVGEWLFLALIAAGLLLSLWFKRQSI